MARLIYVGLFLLVVVVQRSASKECTEAPISPTDIEGIMLCSRANNTVASGCMSIPERAPGYQCHCKPGYFCVNCVDNPCQNGGTMNCTGVFVDSSSYSCNCLAGFGGHDCTQLECTASSCGKNADCYVEENKIRCVCKLDFDGNPYAGGECRPAPGCRTCGSGDPHYTSFDGKYFDYMGTCPYVYTEPCAGADLVAAGISSNFSVIAQNVRYGNSPVSWFQQLWVNVYDVEVHITSSTRVAVNGVAVALPWCLPNCTATPKPKISVQNGVVLETDFGVRVSFSGQGGQACVEVPKRDGLQGQLCGLAGDCNGNQTNDFRTPDGSVVPQATTFGDSWIVNREKCEGGGDLPEPTCDEAERAEAERKCSVLLNTTSPFAPCQHFLAELETAYISCVFDMCATKNDEAQYCRSLASFVSTCQRLSPGVRIDWRKEDLCPPACPQGAHYDACATACPATCQDRTSPDRCSRPCQEGCTCDAGLLLSDGKCVAPGECGCQDGGEYHASNTTWLNADCTKMCSCDQSGMQCHPMQCAPNAKCKIIDYQRDCACDPGWQGDGKSACVDVDECSLHTANGKPYACLNGTCTNTIGSFKCDCQLGFSGEQCDVDICSSGPCTNGGTCTNTHDGSYTCTCVPGFTGHDCETPECTPTSCGENADCYVEHNKIRCVCKPDHDGDPSAGGKCAPFPFCRSCGSGDPHYTSFDGKSFDYQGTCPYVYTEPCASADLAAAGISTNFSIVAKNIGSGRVSNVEQLWINVYDVEVHFVTGTRVAVDGVVVALPWCLPNCTKPKIKVQSGIVLETDFGLRVSFRSSPVGGQACVDVPKVDGLRGHLCGLAGDCDGNQTNDFRTPDGSVVAQATTFGDSWIVNREKCEGGGDLPEPTCDETERAEAERKCSILLNTTSPFAPCQHFVDELETAYISCVFDMCATKQDERQFCGSLAEFVAVCQRLSPGIRIDWRKSDLCPVTCPPGSHYDACATACPATCRDRTSPDQCSRPCQEGCTCDDGLLLSDGKCVDPDECGCQDGELYRANGTKWVNDDCSQACSCEHSKISCSPMRCVENAVCQIVDYKRDCACKPGWQGDGKTACEDVDECSLQSAHGKPYACLNGTCTNTIGSFTCDCSTGFAGEQCDIVIDACASGPCANGGTCRNTDGGYTCTCAPTFTGRNCDYRDCDFCAQYCSASSPVPRSTVKTTQSEQKTTITSPPKGRSRIIAIGGYNRGSQLKGKLVEAYDIDTGTWKRLADLPYSRTGFGIATLNGLVYVVGGQGEMDPPDFSSKDRATVFAYSAASNSWTSVTPMNWPRYGHGAAAVEGRIFALGGFYNPSTMNPMAKSVESFEPQSNKWLTLKSTLGSPSRLGLGVAVLREQLYAIGGRGDNSLATVERYSTALDQWSSVAPMRTARDHLSVAVVNDKLYAIGGQSGSIPLATAEVYDALTNQWTPVANMSAPRVGAGAVGHEGRVYVVGGYSRDSVNPLDSMEMYDPATNVWTRMAGVLSAGRLYLGVTVLPGA